MRDTRFFVLLVGLACAPPSISESLFAPSFIELIDPEPERAGFFGRSCASIPDLTGDGFPDIAVGARGRVLLFNGKTGGYLRTIFPPEDFTGSHFGLNIEGIVDLNGNESGEVIVGSLFTTPGQVFVFDGLSRSVIYELHSADPDNNDGFGRRFSVIPDIDHDSIPEIIVGEPGWDHSPSQPNTGAAHVFSGSSGELIHTLLPPEPLAFTDFGLAVSSVPDINGDGIVELVVGNPRFPSFVQNYGAVFVYDGASGEYLYTVRSPNEQSAGNFGSSLIGVRDVNGNGAGEIAVGTNLEDRVYLMDGLTTEVSHMWRHRGGPIIADACDVNGDGFEDILTVIPFESSGSAFVSDSHSGDVIATIVSPNPRFSGRFGSGAAYLREKWDAANYGIIIGAEHEVRPGNPETSGRAYLFPFKDFIINERSDINMDGRIDALDLLILMNDWCKVSGP